MTTNPTRFRGNRKYPNPITVTDDPKSHTLALQQIIEGLNIGQRRTKDLGNSFVRLSELEDLGLIEIVGDGFNPVTTDAGTSTPAALALDDLTDVSAAAPADGDALTYDTGSGLWVPSAIASSGPTNLSDLLDVSLYMPHVGDVLTYDMYGNWVADSPAEADPIRKFRFFDHFIGELSSSTFSTDWTMAVGGTASVAASGTGIADHPGTVRLTHGMSAAAFARVFHYGDTTGTSRKFFPSTRELSVEFAVTFQTPPTAANNYNAAVGLRAAFNTSISLAAGALIYDSGSSSVRWQLTTRNETTTSLTTLSSAPVTINVGQWYRIKLVVSTAQVRMYVDGVLVAETTGSLPDGGMALYAQMLQSAGSATRYMEVDWVDVQQDLSSVWP